MRRRIGNCGDQREEADAALLGPARAGGEAAAVPARLDALRDQAAAARVDSRACVSYGGHGGPPRDAEGSGTLHKARRVEAHD